MCAYRRYGVAYRRRYRKGSYYRRKSSPYKNFRQSSAVKKGNSQKTVEILNTERFGFNQTSNDKLGLYILENVYQYSSFACIRIDIIKYMMNHPIFNGYMKMYNKFWVQGFAVKNKILGPVVPTHTTNIKGQYWITITDNTALIPLPNLENTTGGINQSINEILQVLS